MGEHDEIRHSPFRHSPLQKSGGLGLSGGLDGDQMMETPMLSPDRIPDLTLLHEAAADYDVVRRAIGHIRSHWREQPEIDAIAEAASVTPTELHHLFRRWAGLTPKAFLQALTLDGARQLLRDSASVLDATYEVGLSGPGRLHDLFVTHEAMSPGEWKTGGEGLTIRFGFHPSPFGSALVMATERGLAGLAFADPGEERAALADMKARGPRATYLEDSARTAVVAKRIFDQSQWQESQPLRVVLIGTDWEVRVWEALMQIPMGRLVTYSDVAGKGRSPAAARPGGGRRRRRQESGVVRGAVPPRRRQIGRAHRLSLGHHPQARHARLGGGAGWGCGVVSFSSSPSGLTRGSMLNRRVRGLAPWIAGSSPAMTKPH